MKDDKILQDEIMSDDELDNIAGGTYQELNELYGAINSVGMLKKYIKNSKPGNIDVNEINNILKEKLGVELKYNADGANQYEFYLGGQKTNHSTVVNEIKRYEWAYNHF